MHYKEQGQEQAIITNPVSKRSWNLSAFGDFLTLLRKPSHKITTTTDVTRRISSLLTDLWGGMTNNSRPYDHSCLIGEYGSLKISTSTLN